MSKYIGHLIKQSHFINRELYKNLEGTPYEGLALDLVKNIEELKDLYFNSIDYAPKKTQED